MSYGRYQKNRPLLYHTRYPILWWVKKWAYVRFILRELTSVAVAFYVVVLLLFVNSVSQGPESFAAFNVWLRSPLSVGLHGIAIVAVLYHSITWFNLAPKALVIRVGKKSIPGRVILITHYAMWAIVSTGLYWLITTT